MIFPAYFPDFIQSDDCGSDADGNIADSHNNTNADISQVCEVL